MEPRTHRFEPLVLTGDQYAQANGWPWMVIGVFPTEDDVAKAPPSRYTAFCYTVGLDADPCLWVPCLSIEDRFAGPDLITWIVNPIALALRDNVVRPGDSVLVRLGRPGPRYAEDPTDVIDEEAVFWIGELEPNDRRRHTYRSDAARVLPMLWSSPLGFAEEY